MPIIAPLPQPDPADELAEAHMAALKRLREKGMDIADRLHAASEDPDADLGEIATRFARVARTVRQTIFLESRLAEEARRRRLAAAPQDSAFELPWWIKLRVSVAEGRQDNLKRKLAVTRVVERAIGRTAEAAERERLEDELRWRLEKPPYEDTKLGVPALIERLSHDLGLAADWSAFSDRDWRFVDKDIRKALLSGGRGDDADREPPPAPIEGPEPGTANLSPVPPEPDRRRRSPPPTSWM